MLVLYITKEIGLGVCRMCPCFPESGSQILGSPYKRRNVVTVLSYKSVALYSGPDLERWHAA